MFVDGEKLTYFMQEQNLLTPEEVERELEITRFHIERILTNKTKGGATFIVRLLRYCHKKGLDIFKYVVIMD